MSPEGIETLRLLFIAVVALLVLGAGRGRASDYRGVRTRDLILQCRQAAKRARAPLSKAPMRELS